MKKPQYTQQELPVPDHNSSNTSPPYRMQTFVSKCTYFCLYRHTL